MTKSGGREFHGNIYAFLRDDALNANDFFLNSAGQPRPVLTAQQFGGTNPLGNLFPGMPTLTVTGLFTLGSSPLADQSSRINSFGFQDTLSVVYGRHRLKVGGGRKMESSRP